MFAYNKILPDIWLGEHLRAPDDIKMLVKDTNIDAILSLQTDDDLGTYKIDWRALSDCYEQRHITLNRIPIVDFDAVDLRKKLPIAARALNDLINAGHHTYVHCTLGLNRAPTVIIAYLVWFQDWPLDRAWYHVKEQRECLPSFEAVWLAIREQKENSQP